MKERSNVGLIITLVVIALLMGVGGFFLGMRMASDGYLAEEELNIRLNRSELEGLGKIEGSLRAHQGRASEGRSGRECGFSVRPSQHFP